jgi:hypothetical protein
MTSQWAARHEGRTIYFGLGVGSGTQSHRKAGWRIAREELESEVRDYLLP